MSICRDENGGHYGTPLHVERAFREYLECGILLARVPMRSPFAGRAARFLPARAPAHHTAEAKRKPSILRLPPVGGWESIRQFGAGRPLKPTAPLIGVITCPNCGAAPPQAMPIARGGPGPCP